MANLAKSAFTVDQQDAVPAEGWEGGQLNHTRLVKTFTGDLAGTSVVESIMAGLDGGGPQVYVAVERVDGHVDGRRGSFVLLHSASFHAGEATASWTIVPGSGTGELAGIRGEAKILPEHQFELRYDLGE